MTFPEGFLSSQVEPQRDHLRGAEEEVPRGAPAAACSPMAASEMNIVTTTAATHGGRPFPAVARLPWYGFMDLSVNGDGGDLVSLRSDHAVQIDPILASVR